MNPRIPIDTFDHLQWLAVLLVPENGCHGNQKLVEHMWLFITHGMICSDHHSPVQQSHTKKMLHCYCQKLGGEVVDACQMQPPYSYVTGYAYMSVVVFCPENA